MVTVLHAAQVPPRLPLLEAGDHLDQATFHARYKAMPPSFHAELIGGMVIVPSPLSRGHGVYLALAMILEAPMVTADERFYRATRSAGTAEHVVWVGDVP